jgi:hypothetical protein
MSELVPQLLSIGGRSLEREEDSLRTEAERKGRRGGILTIDEICFVQYVFGRAILPEFDSRLEFTRDGRRVGELRVTFERKRYVFILEHWKDEPLFPLQDHVDRLARQKGEAFLVVFSANPHAETESRLRAVEGLQGVGPRFGIHRFRAQTEQGEDHEFWVGAWPVARMRSASSPQRGRLPTPAALRGTSARGPGQETGRGGRRRDRARLRSSPSRAMAWRFSAAS